MKYCQNCGNQISDTVKFCSNCGFKIENSMLNPEISPTEITGFDPWDSVKIDGIKIKCFEEIATSGKPHIFDNVQRKFIYSSHIQAIINSFYLSNDIIEELKKLSTEKKGVLVDSDGNIYVGELNNEKKHGLGSLLKKIDGNKFIIKYFGSWENDEQNGYGILLNYIEGTLVYQGEWKNGRYNGIGKKYWEEGMLIYEGQFKENKEYGLGTEYFRHLYAPQFNGNFNRDGISNLKKFKVDGTLCEKGEYIYDFDSYSLHGKGIKYFDDGTVFEGKWKNGERNGKGKLIYGNGAVYEGEWKKDNKHGQGKYIGIDDFVYEGEWVNDQRIGIGKQTSPDGSIYEGEWKNNQIHGNGKSTQSNGDVFEGEWKDGGNSDGIVKLTMTNGDVFEGTIENNNFVASIHNSGSSPIKPKDGAGIR